MLEVEDQDRLWSVIMIEVEAIVIDKEAIMIDVEVIMTEA